MANKQIEKNNSSKKNDKNIKDVDSINTSENEKQKPKDIKNEQEKNTNKLKDENVKSDSEKNTDSKDTEKNKHKNKKLVQKYFAGDVVDVSIKVIEGTRTRTQVFNGVIIAINNSGVSKTITVRKISYGVGVERIFPIYSPQIERIDIISHGKVRRAKLYYLRKRSGKATRIKEKI